MTAGKVARPSRVIAFTALLLGGVVMIMPIVYMLLTSLKDNSEIYELHFLPRAPTLDNYASILGRSPFGRCSWSPSRSLPPPRFRFCSSTA